MITWLRQILYRDRELIEAAMTKHRQAADDHEDVARDLQNETDKLFRKIVNGHGRDQ